MWTAILGADDWRLCMEGRFDLVNEERFDLLLDVKAIVEGEVGSERARLPVCRGGNAVFSRVPARLRRLREVMPEINRMGRAA